MIAALVTESGKLLHATAIRITTALIVLGIPAICSSLLLAADTSEPQLAAKLGPLVDPGGWSGYLTTATQVTAAGGLLGYGVVLSWLYGREFGDGTICGLFALPVARSTIALAKILVFLAWAAATGLALVSTLVICGYLSGLGAIPSSAAAPIGRQLALTVLTGIIILPAAVAATLGRSTLAGIGVSVGILISSQVTAVAGGGTWFPFTAPALWALDGDPAAAPGLILVIPLGLLSAALTARSWQRLQLDR